MKNFESKIKSIVNFGVHTSIITTASAFTFMLLILATACLFSIAQFLFKIII